MKCPFKTTIIKMKVPNAEVIGDVKETIIKEFGECDFNNCRAFNNYTCGCKMIKEGEK